MSDAPDLVASATRNSPVNRASDTAHQQINKQEVRTDLGPATLVVISILALVIGFCGVVMGINLSKQAREDEDYRTLKTQTWLLERRLMDREALDIVNGIKLPSDDEHGATGNLQRMKAKE